MDTIKIRDKKNTLIIAHRGLSGIELENTCSAFVAAGNRSYFGIETDVHITRDGRFIIFHDDTTARIAIDDMCIEQSTFDTLRGLILADRDGKRGRRDLIMPELCEYISLCKKYGKKAVLELKNAFKKEEIAQIADIISSLDYFSEMIFISFEMINLEYMRELHPEANVQFLTSEYSEELIETLSEKKMDLDILYTELNRENIAALHSAGIKVNCWTCDDKDFAQNLIDWGIDYITSNILE